MATAAGWAVAGLAGCGADGSQNIAQTTGAVQPIGADAASAAQQVSGRIAPELVFADAEVGSVYGPSTVAGNTFTTSISPNSVGLLVLGDRSGGVRGFSLTLPGETPVFSAENSALAIVFMEPGFLQLNPNAAKLLQARIRASSAFAPFVQILMNNAQSRRLELLSGDADYVAALETLIHSLGNPYLVSPPSSSLENARTVAIKNESPRFLYMVTDGPSQDRLLPPYGRLTDIPVDSSTFTFYGLGPASALPGDTSLIESTYFLTMVFAVFMPWLELAVGKEIPVELGMALTKKLTVQGLAARNDLASVTSMAEALSDDCRLTVAEVADTLPSSSGVIGLILAITYVAGLAFVIGGITRFKSHKDNPSTIALGTPRSMEFTAEALLSLPSVQSLNPLSTFS
ncbi:hypothetical protein JST97_19965 [bacterium]|nr:hypothetical protein [bacterium]